MKKKLYETPACTVIPLATEYALLTKSPVARPGGGGGGHITITPATPDQSSDPDDDVLDED